MLPIRQVFWKGVNETATNPNLSFWFQQKRVKRSPNYTLRLVPNNGGFHLDHRTEPGAEINFNQTDRFRLSIYRPIGAEQRRQVNIIQSAGHSTMKARPPGGGGEVGFVGGNAEPKAAASQQKGFFNLLRFN